MPSPGSKHKRIANALRQRILGGDLKPGASPGKVRDLAAQFECSAFTVHRAMKALAQEGLLSLRQGSGVRVRAAAPTPVGRRVLTVFPKWDHLQEESFAAQFLLGVNLGAAEAGVAVEALPLRADEDLAALRGRIGKGNAMGAVWANAVHPLLLARLEAQGMKIITTHRHHELQESPYTRDDFDAGFDTLIKALHAGGVKRLGLLCMEPDDTTYEPICRLLLEKCSRAGIEVPESCMHRSNRYEAASGKWKRRLEGFLPDAWSRVDAWWSFSPQWMEALRAWAAENRARKSQRKTLCSLSIRTWQISGIDWVLESDVSAHGRRAMQMLIQWIDSGVRPDVASLPLKLIGNAP